MERELTYSFHDEPVTKFCYDLENKQIEVHFASYCDHIKDEEVPTPCVWIIEDWEQAKCRIGAHNKMYDINQQIGIFELILYMRYNEDEDFELFVQTIDQRNITLYFKDPKLSLKTKDI